MKRTELSSFLDSRQNASCVSAKLIQFRNSNLEPHCFPLRIQIFRSALSRNSSIRILVVASKMDMMADKSSYSPLDAKVTQNESMVSNNSLRGGA